jgi:hypothetical protein
VQEATEIIGLSVIEAKVEEIVKATILDQEPVVILLGGAIFHLADGCGGGLSRGWHDSLYAREYQHQPAGKATEFEPASLPATRA